MRLFSISRRLAACVVLALPTVSAPGQTPGPFQSAPGPAPVARPAPRPRPPAAEPPPAVVAPQSAPAPAAPARPEGALSAAELRQFVDATWTGASQGGSWYAYAASDGRSFLKGVSSGGRPIADSGHWSIENDTWCSQMDHLFSGRRNCMYVFKKGNGYEARNLDGTSNAEFTSQPGNPYRLP